ncbi:hypothetical protein ACWEQU_06255 [Streptomyces nodosus]
MTNGTGPARGRRPQAKTTIRVYTVSRSGIVSPPRATVTMSYGRESAPTAMSTVLPPCACPLYRKLGAVR